MDESLQELIRSQQELGRKLASAEALADFDLSKLRSWGDLDLALWQVQHGPDSMQNILAAQEWQRRITARQIRASHITAWVGVVGTLAGVFFGWWLGSLQHRSDPVVQAQSHAASQPAVQQPVSAPPQAKTPTTTAPVQQPPNPSP